MSTALELPTIEPLPASASAVKFHLSLNVSDLDRSIAFLRAMFGREPAKRRPDYAKFELDEPPLVLSLEPHAPTSFGALNHLGFRLRDSAELVEWQQRLELAGITTQREEGVECCYARQTKFWVRDPDNNLWEIYVLDEDIEHRGAGQAPDQFREPHTATVAASTEPAKAIWQHQLGTPLPARIVALDNSTAEVQLRGSFNTPHAAAARQTLLAEIRRILQPGGTVHLHMLTSQRACDLAFGTLPGPASYVTHVPELSVLLADLTAAGFEEIAVTKHGETPCFRHEGNEMRETMILARRPAS